MSKIDVERSVSPTLRARSAGQTDIRRCLELQDEAPRLSRLARVLGHSPLHPDAVACYGEAIAAQETGRRLASIRGGYSVLHSLPIGDGERALQMEVEHLVIGPSGVFCLSSAPSVTAERLEAVAREARQLSKHLSRALQRVVPVTPLLVTVGSSDSKRGSASAAASRDIPARTSASAPASLAAARPDPDVEVVSARALANWFAKRGPVLTTAELVTLTLAAEQPATWNVPPEVLEGVAALTVALADFEELRIQVEDASDRERVTLSVAVAVAVIVMLVSAAIIVSAASGLLRLAGF
jgi:hypothetical protein